MIKCPKCNYDNKDDATWCSLCGEVLRREEKYPGIYREPGFERPREPIEKPSSQKRSKLFPILLLVVCIIVGYKLYRRSISTETIYNNEESIIFLKESNRMNVRFYFQRKSDFCMKALVMNIGGQHKCPSYKEFFTRTFFLAPEELVLKIFPKDLDALVEIIRTGSLPRGASRKEKMKLVRRLKRAYKKDLFLALIPEDSFIKEKLYSIKKGDIIEIKGFRGNLLRGKLDGKIGENIWYSKSPRNKDVYVKELQILDSF